MARILVLDYVRMMFDLNKITVFPQQINDGITGVGMLLGLAVLVQARPAMAGPFSFFQFTHLGFPPFPLNPSDGFMIHRIERNRKRATQTCR